MDLGDCPPIQGLQGELKQLVANLISNAADAVEPGGKIRISLATAQSEHGNGVAIQIADNGPGVPEKNRAHIFEPFFTTKEDVGTGLGLWVSKEIAERHGGNIRLDTANNNGLGGAVFTVFLPFEAHLEAAGGAA
jgi:signal transduction histidine kinase